MKITALQIREIFGNPVPPLVIWEEQFDGFNKELVEIGTKDWRHISEADL